MTDNTTARSRRRTLFSRLSSGITRATGSSYGFPVALAVVLVWGSTGLMVEFSTAWQRLVSISMSTFTFLMVFVMKHAQNRDTQAIHLKLNELIASNSAANNRLVNIEEMSPEELAVVKKFYGKLAIHVETATDVHASHSLDEANTSGTSCAS